MGSFNKKYIIREAECILEECNKKINNRDNSKNKIMSLTVKNKRLKRKNLFWKVCTAISCTLLIISVI